MGVAASMAREAELGEADVAGEHALKARAANKAAQTLRARHHL